MNVQSCEGATQHLFFRRSMIKYIKDLFVVQKKCLEVWIQTHLNGVVGFSNDVNL